MAVMMVLAVMTVPATRALMESFETSAGVRTLISAALCNARAIAAKEQRYAGVRFQRDIKGNQYMIFIIHDPDDPDDPASTADGIGTGLANGFRAIEGKKPIKLPANIGVMDLYVKDNYLPAGPPPIDQGIDDAAEVMDVTTFSIVFSPTGKLVVHEVRVRNRSGRADPDHSSLDDIFNTDLNVDADTGRGMFYQDDYAALGLGQERSRKWFVVYDKKAFDAVRTSQRWSGYLTDLDKVYVNPRTGEVINY